MPRLLTLIGLVVGLLVVSGLVIRAPLSRWIQVRRITEPFFDGHETLYREATVLRWGPHQGKAHGTVRLTRTDGSLHSTHEMFEGVASGITREFRPDGSLQSESSWRDGERHGWVRSYDQDSRLEKQIEYHRGYRLGVATRYRKARIVRQEIFPHGRGSCAWPFGGRHIRRAPPWWDPDARITSLEPGRVRLEVLHENGTPAVQLTVDLNDWHLGRYAEVSGTERHWYPSGMLRILGTHQEAGEREFWTYWCKTGRLILQRREGIRGYTVRMDPPWWQGLTDQE